MELATFGGGCFWCLEAVFLELRGVHSVTSGYAGGHTEKPTYQQVCSESTGHAEVVQIAYDPDIISFQDLLHVFFTIHDPSTANRQGADIGTQYRSIVLYHDDDQKRLTDATIAQLLEDDVWNRITTQVEPLQAFWPAEVYHKDYYRRNPDQAYCRAVIAPKVAKLRKHHLDKLRVGA